MILAWLVAAGGQSGIYGGVWMGKDSPIPNKTINSDWGGAVEPNTFGADELMDFVDQISSEAYVLVNVGSGRRPASTQEARGRRSRIALAVIPSASHSSLAPHRLLALPFAR